MPLVCVFGPVATAHHFSLLSLFSVSSLLLSSLLPSRPAQLAPPLPPRPATSAALPPFLLLERAATAVRAKLESLGQVHNHLFAGLEKRLQPHCLQPHRLSGRPRDGRLQPHHRFRLGLVRLLFDCGPEAVVARVWVVATRWPLVMLVEGFGEVGPQPGLIGRRCVRPRPIFRKNEAFVSVQVLPLRRARYSVVLIFTPFAKEWRGISPLYVTSASYRS